MVEKFGSSSATTHYVKLTTYIPYLYCVRQSYLKCILFCIDHYGSAHKLINFEEEYSAGLPIIENYSTAKFSLSAFETGRLYKLF